MLSDGTQKNHARAAEGILTPSRPRRGAERHTAPPPSQVRPPARPADSLSSSVVLALAYLAYFHCAVGGWTDYLLF